MGGKLSVYNSMKYIFTICLLFTSVIGFAQIDSVSLKQAMSDLDKALVTKDEKALLQLLHADVSYGHSNGWVQNKTDIINDLRSGLKTQVWQLLP